MLCCCCCCCRRFLQTRGGLGGGLGGRRKERTNVVVIIKVAPRLWSQTPGWKIMKPMGHEKKKKNSSKFFLSRNHPEKEKRKNSTFWPPLVGPENTLRTYAQKYEHLLKATCFDVNDFDDREEELWNSSVIYHHCRHVFVVVFFLFSICCWYRGSLSSISKSNREWRTTGVWINGPTSFVFLFFVFLESHKGKEHEERTQPAKTKIWEHYKSVGVRGRRPGGGFRHFVNALLDRVVPNSSDTTGSLER